MDNKSYSIEDLLNSLHGDTNSSTSKFSNAEIWSMIGAKESFEKMGFSSEDEMKDFIATTPYESLN